MGQPCLHPDELSPDYSDRFHHRHLGISFIVFLFAGTVATLLSGVGEPPQRRALAITVGVVMFALFLFGEWRLGSNPSAQSVAVTLMAKDVPMSVYLGPEDQALGLLHQYADEVRRATPAGTEVVVLPEKIARVGEGRLLILGGGHPAVGRQQARGTAGGGWALFFGRDCYKRGDCPRAGPARSICRIQFFAFLFARWKVGGELRQASSCATG